MKDDERVQGTIRCIIDLVDAGAIHRFSHERRHKFRVSTTKSGEYCNNDMENDQINSSNTKLKIIIITVFESQLAVCQSTINMRMLCVS